MNLTTHDRRRLERDEQISILYKANDDLARHCNVLLTAGLNVASEIEIAQWVAQWHKLSHCLISMTLETCCWY